MERVQVGAAAWLGEGVLGLLPGQAPRQRVLAGQPGLRVGERRDVREQPRVEPGLAAPHVLGVDRQPLAQLEAGVGGARGELLDLRPRALGVDVVGGQRGDPAPVVDARAAISSAYSSSTRFGGAWMRAAGPRISRATAIGRGQFVQFGVRHAAHRGVRLGAEVLHDHFLDAVVPRATRRIANSDSARSA